MSEHHKAYERDKVVEIINSVMEQFEKDSGLSREKLAVKLLDLAHVIEEARTELAQMRPRPVAGEEEEAGAMDELDAVVAETATATGVIMDSCDIINDALEDIEDPQKSKVSKAVTDIYEACSFQDITGQRITKVVKSLKIIDEKVDALVSLIGKSKLKAVVQDDDTNSGSHLLNGPQLADKAMSQEDIDKLLDSFD